MELEGFLELHCGAKGGESQGGGGVDEKSGGIDAIELSWTCGSF